MSRVRIQRWVPSRTVLLALFAALIFILVVVGTLDELWGWLRALVQALGVLSGIYLGYLLTFRDEQMKLEAEAETAIGNLVALAEGLKACMELNAGFSRSCAESPPRSIDSFGRMTEVHADGMDSHLRSLLMQAQIAAVVWKPHVVDFDATLSRLSGGSNV